MTYLKTFTKGQISSIRLVREASQCDGMWLSRTIPVRVQWALNVCVPQEA